MGGGTSCNLRCPSCELCNTSHNLCSTGCVLCGPCNICCTSSIHCSASINSNGGPSCNIRGTSCDNSVCCPSRGCGCWLIGSRCSIQCIGPQPRWYDHQVRIQRGDDALMRESHEVMVLSNHH